MANDLGKAGSNGVVTAGEAERLASELGVDAPRLMTLLLPAAAAYARPPISRYRVGAVARGITHGNLYFGANLEFAGEALSFTVHAEQSAVANAWSHGEEGIDLVATSAPPCGYCRQFLNELSTAPRLGIVTAEGTTPLAELLPGSFGPHDLGVSAGLMASVDHALTAETPDELSRLALAAANRSHAPYSKSWAGAAVQTRGGVVAGGSYAENAAFNPSLSPLQAALSNLNLRGGRFEEIDDAVLVHIDPLHTSSARTVLAALCDAPLRTIAARNSLQPTPR